MSITISGSTGISGVDGSSTTPAFQGTDTNTGLFYGTDIVGISTGGSERVRVDASGNVGIGTTSPNTKLDVRGSSGLGIKFLETSSGNTNRIELGTGSGIGYVNADAGIGSIVLGFNVAGTERMRIDSSGNVMVGTTSQVAQGKFNIVYQNTSTQGLNFNENSGSGLTRDCIRFQTSGTQVGGISVSTTATAYNTSSDYRLKENIQPMIGALDTIAQLKPVTYDWIADGSKGQGFIAHELQEVVPDCVTGEKDAVDADGNHIYQGIDTSFLVATLTAAIQEQQTIINDLKARVTALETSNV